MDYNRQVTISVGVSRKAVNWQAQTLGLDELYEKLRIPARSTESQAAYLAMTKGQRDELKDIGGFVAGTLQGSRRKAGAVTGRDLLALDLDNIPAGGADDVLRRVEGLGCGYCVYSTRKHMPSAPRLRVLIPLDRTCTADEYEPCARRVAASIGIEMADPSTFEAHRLMYWPSCCADGQYIYYAADKPMASVDGLLATYADWRDQSSWPAVPGTVSPAKLAAKQGDPLAKPGVVGGFCRVYDIEAAMAAFLPGVYDPAGEGRFTYTGGSTTGGAVLYDNGKFLYSHHATDPCGGKLVNAFDLVRIHRFGEQDDEAAPGTPMNRMPSYAAMCEFASQDSGVSEQLAEEHWKKVQETFSPVPGAAAEDDGAWRRQLTTKSNGVPENTMRNLKLTVMSAPELRGKIRLNLFSGRVDVTGETPWFRPGGSANWTDDDTIQLRIHLEKFFSCKLPKNDVQDIVSACASERAYHPVREYLEGLIWDGVERLDGLFIDYLGAQNSPYTRAVTRKAFTAAVARIMAPGCKYDTMPVLIGGQGRHKSTILAKMGGDWFSDSLRSFGDKDSMETIQGTWLNELAEMQALNKADINAVKMFLSKTSDYYRASYGRFAAEHLRQCVFFGTTNSRECLTDPTGSRRFLPIDIDQQLRTKNVFLNLDGERDQLWAEAVARWKAGEPLHLPPELEEVARAVQEDHRAKHPWEGLIREFLDRPIPPDWNTWDLTRRRVFWSGGVKDDPGTGLVQRDRVCALEVWCELLDGRQRDMKKNDSREINDILGALPGWERTNGGMRCGCYGTQRGFQRV